MPPLPCSCFCLLSPPADLPHPHFTRLFLTRIFRHLPFPPLPGKQEKTRQNQEALLLFLPYSRIIYTGVVAEVKGWAESAIHYRHSLQQNTPHRPPTMGSHETGRCSSRLVATAALEGRLWRGKQACVMNRLGFCDHQEMLETEKVKDGGVALRLSLKFMFLAKFWNLTSQILWTRSRKCVQHPPVSYGSSWHCGNTAQHSARRQLAEGSKADTFFAFFG